MNTRNLTAGLIVSVLLVAAFGAICIADESDADVAITDFGYSSDSGYTLKADLADGTYTARVTTTGEVQAQMVTFSASDGKLTMTNNPDPIVTDTQYLFTLKQGNPIGGTELATIGFQVYEVTFNGTSGTGTMSSVIATGVYTLPDCGFTSDDYEFAGWQVNGTGDTLSAGEQITVSSDIELVATWTEKSTEEPITVTFISDGQIVSTQSVDYDASVFAPAVTKTGYTLQAWEDGEGTTYKFPMSVTADLTVYAQWEPITYTIVFNGNADGVTGSMSSMDMTYDVAKNLNANGFVLAGYRFIGWSTAADGEAAYGNNASVENLTDVNGATVTLYAQWDPIGYTIVFDANGGEGTMDSMQMEYGEQKNLSLNEFEYEGFNFTGWNTSEDGTGTKYADGALVSNLTTENGATVTLYAQWDEEPVTTHDVTFDLGYEGAGSSTTTVKDGDPVLRPEDPTRDGYTFSGWYLDGESYDFSTPVTGPIILVAQWEKIPVLESIEVTTLPTETEYTVGEKLDLSGLEVTAKYSDGKTQVVTDYTTDPVAGAILNTAGFQTVTVTYEGKTTSFAITVNPDETTVGPTITVDTNLGGKVVSSGSVDNGDGTYTVTVVVAPTTGFTVYNVYVSNGYTYETEGMPEDISDIVTAGNVTITIFGVTDSVDVDVTFVPLILDDDDDDPTNPPVVVDPKEDDNSVVIVAIAAGVVVAILAALILMHTRKN